MKNARYYSEGPQRERDQKSVCCAVIQEVLCGERSDIVGVNRRGRP
jgi:hypothetical protein